MSPQGAISANDTADPEVLRPKVVDELPRRRHEACHIVRKPDEQDSKLTVAVEIGGDLEAADEVPLLRHGEQGLGRSRPSGR